MKRRLFPSIPVSLLSAGFFMFAVCFCVSAQTAESKPRLEADPEVYNFTVNFDSTDWKSLFKLAWWASGAPDGETAADNFAPVITELSNSVSSKDDRRKAEYVLEFMHNEFLKSYQIKQTRLDTLFSTGRFNCVSSAVLYAILGAAVGLDVSGINTIDHAFCSVSIDDEQIDVETTNIYGFDPGNRVDFQDEFGKTTGYSYVPPGNYRSRNDIDRTRLLSLIIQNRIADAESAGRYDEAVGLAVDRWVLLGGGEGAEFEDLIVRMLNYGTLLSRAGREEEALDWAASAVGTYGPHPEWNEFIDGTVNNLVLKLVQKDLFSDARLRFDELLPVLSPEAAAGLNVMISDNELLYALDAVKAGGSDADFIETLDKVKFEGVLSDGRLREIELNWRLYEIDKIAKTEGWAAAHTAVENTIIKMGNDPLLERAGRVYLSNQKAELYNRAADAFNSRRYEDARILAQEALNEFPGEAIFQSLLMNIDRALGGD